MVLGAQIISADLYDFIFKTILQLPRCTGGGDWGCLTGDFSHDFIISLLLPHIIILIFIYGASQGLGHKGLSSLFGLGIYTFVIYSGWYPLFATFTLFWLVIAIVISFYFFIVGKIFPPAKTESIQKALKGMRNKRFLKQEIKRLESELRRTPANRPEERAKLQKRLSELREKLAVM